MQRKGFSWIEALIVLVVLSVLALILYPVFGRQGHPNRSACQFNLKQIGLGFMQYVQDYDNKFPPVAVAPSGYWVGAVQPYLKSWQLFQCPSAGGSHEKTTDYFYNARLARVVDKNIVSPTQTILMGDGSNDSPTNYALSQLPAAWVQDETSPAWRHLGTAYYAFSDGHVKALKADRITSQPIAKGNYCFAVR